VHHTIFTRRPKSHGKKLKTRPAEKRHNPQKLIFPKPCRLILQWEAGVSFFGRKRKPAFAAFGLQARGFGVPSALAMLFVRELRVELRAKVCSRIDSVSLENLSA